MTKVNSSSGSSPLEVGQQEPVPSQSDSLKEKKRDNNSIKSKHSHQRDSLVTKFSQLGSTSSIVQQPTVDMPALKTTSAGSQNKMINESMNWPMSQQIRNLRPGDIREQPAAGQQHGRCCGCFMCFLFCCTTSCYVFCPPVPSQITRKVAFHPPIRGHFYRLKYVNDAGQEVEVKSAKEAFGRETVILDPTFTDAEQKAYAQMSMSSSKVFVVKTSRKHYLPCVLFESNPASEKVILFSQANATDLGLLTQLDINMHDLSREMNIDVYCYDYSGFGLSTGTPSEKNIYDDVQAVYDHIVRTRPDVKIILIGFSMGTAASVDLASKKPKRLAGVVLLAPFCSGIRLLTSAPGKESTTCCDPFQSIDKCRLIDVPTLLIHGHRDEVVPLQHSREMHKRLRKPARPLYIFEANHMTVFSREFPQTMKRMRNFIHNELDQ